MNFMMSHWFNKQSKQAIMHTHTNIKERAKKSMTQHQAMKTSAQLLEFLHFEPGSSMLRNASAAADLFPEMLHLEINRLNKGCVFGVLVESYGVGMQHREVIVDRDGVLKVAKFRSLPATEHGKASVSDSGSSVIKLAQGNGNRRGITDCR
jgi:hypothetical protein